MRTPDDRAAAWDALADTPALAELDDPLYVVAIGARGAVAWPFPVMRCAELADQLTVADHLAAILRQCADDMEARAELVRAVDAVEAP